MQLVLVQAPKDQMTVVDISDTPFSFTAWPDMLCYVRVSVVLAIDLANLLSTVILQVLNHVEQVVNIVNDVIFIVLVWQRKLLLIYLAIYQLLLSERSSRDVRGNMNFCRAAC